MALTANRVSSFSLHSASKRVYDVFLSFRVEDTAASFTQDLYEALKHQGIVVFKDGGNNMAQKLKAIEESRSSIVVLSDNYSDSNCMKELTKIIAMNQLVLPIFYQIDPANVRKQKGNFEMPFSEHEANVENDVGEVQDWRDSMNEVGNFSGWHLTNPQSETEAIKEIVKHVFNKLRPDLFSCDEKLVGISPRLHQVNMLLGIGLDDVRFVGIWGMGGIGKTTIARLIHNSVAHAFDGCYFLDNVKETIKVEGITSLWKKLLSGTLMKRNIEIPDGDGAAFVKRRMSPIKTLLVLDDVNHLSQLQQLAGSENWFGAGSRVIITTRDEHLLTSHGIERRYNVEGLNVDEALVLFSQKAFRADYPRKGYYDLSSQVVDYTGGLPLALEVLGSSLRDKPVEAWENAVDKLKDVRDEKILEKLMLSYHMLEEPEQEIFLDVACFFKRKSKLQAIEILQSFGFPAIVGLDILEEKSLITIPHGKIQMHDLIQEMGQEIVCQMFPNMPEKRSRLWLRKDIDLALSLEQGMEDIEGIVMDTGEHGESHLNAKSFSAMTKLRVLKISNTYLSGDLEFLSDQLRFLSWHRYPLKCLPSNFHPNSLLELELPSSCIEHLWKGSKSLDKLKVINLSDSQFLSKTPDFSGAPNLERLILSGCIRLYELHQSVGTLKHLVQLDLKDCTRLRSIPFNISLESLNILVLSGCSGLKNFPAIVGNMNYLIELHLDGTGIRELHPSIGYLTGLVSLNLTDCTNLQKLPGTIGCLISLKILTLRGCSKLDQIPECLGKIACLEKLDITGTSIHQAPLSLQLLTNLEIINCQGLSRKFIHSLFPSWNLSWNHSHSQGLKLANCFSSFGSVRILNLSYCNLLDGDLPNDLHSLSSLQILHLSGNKFIRLPESISHLTNLKDLFLNNCGRLQSLPKLPLSVREVEARDCVSLQEYYNKEKHIPSGEMGVTFIRCPISAEPQSYKVDQLDLSVSSIHLRTMAQRYLEVLTWQQQQYHLFFPYPKFIACFDEKRYGSSITVHCPPDYISDENARIGIALGAAFEVQKHECDSLRISHHFVIRMETDECPIKPPIIFDTTKDELAWPHGIMIFYIPMKEISKWLNRCCCIDIWITHDKPFVKVKWCGASVLYEQNSGTFIGRIIKGLFGSPGILHESILDHILNRQKRVNVSNLLDGGTHYKACWLNALQRTIGSRPKFQPSEQSEVTEDCSTSFYASSEIQECESDSTIMLRQNLKSVLLRTFEDLKLYGEYYVFPHRGISKSCFPLQVKIPKVTIRVPPNLHRDKRWMGLAYFAVFAVDETSNISHSFSSQVENDEYRMRRGSIFYLHPGLFDDSYQLWLFYEPRAVYSYRLNHWRHLCVSFSTSNTQVKVVLCGARLVYKQDLEGFVQTITNCVSGCPADLHDFLNKQYVEGLLKLIKSHKYDPKQKGNEEKEDMCLQVDQGTMNCDPRNSNPTSSAPLALASQNLKSDSDHILLLKERITSFLQRDLQDRFGTSFDFIIPGRDIPQLFSTQPQKNIALIELPPTLYTNSDWIGFAVSALFQVNKHPTAIVDNLGSVTSHELLCQFAIERGLLQPLHSHTVTEDRFIWLCERQFIWLYYTPRKKYGHIFRHCRYLHAAIEADTPDLTVRHCGLHLVHKQDMEKIDNILMESIASLPSNSRYIKQF